MALKRKVPPKPPAAAEVTISDDVVRMMLHDTRFISNFPCVKQAKNQATKKKCNCGGSRTKLGHVNIGKLRRNLANMSASKKLILKQLLNAKTVLLKFPKQTGGTAVKRF